METTAPEHQTRHGRQLLGKLLSLVGGLLLAGMALVAALFGAISWSVVDNTGPDSYGPLACRTQDCADQYAIGAVVLFGFVALVMVALVLALRSTDRALKLVAVGSFIVGGILLILIVGGGAVVLLTVGDDADGLENAWPLLTPAAAPLLLGVGSALRLSARRGRS